MAAEVIGAHYAAIGVLAPDGRLLESFTTYGIDDELRALIGPPAAGPRHPRAGDPGGPPHPPARSDPASRLLRLPAAPSADALLPRRARSWADAACSATSTSPRRSARALFTEEDEHIAVLLAAQRGGRGGERPAARGERAAAGGGPAAAPGARAVLRHGEPRAAERARGGVRLVGDAGAEEGSRPPCRAAAFEVLDSAQQAIGLINDLLDLSRLDEDRLKPVIRPIEPGSVARRAAGRVTPAAEARQVTLVLEVASPDLPSLRDRCEPGGADPRQPAGQRDSARAARGARSDSRSPRAMRLVVFTVEDEGPGVPASELERIFDIYVTKKDGESAASAWACRSPGGWPGCSAGSCARCPGRGGRRASSCWSCRPRRHHEEHLHDQASRRVQSRVPRLRSHENSRRGGRPEGRRDSSSRA